MVAWQEIESVLLDMDGTLLDKEFDDYFWEELVPEKFAETTGVPIAEAKERLYAAFRATEQTLAWTDLDYWSKEIGLDIVSLKQEIRGRVKVHPGVEPFLRFVREKGKKIALVTNAHPKTVQIKLGQTNLSPYLDIILCSSDIGLPKEEVRFWEGAQAALEFDKERSLFVDDNETVLFAAQAFGIRHLFFKTDASSRILREGSKHFQSIRHFGELLPLSP
ncbi:MAG: GMP/IMP nucleotidase [Candidatus Manganitrophaceae bacterium]